MGMSGRGREKAVEGVKFRVATLGSGRVLVGRAVVLVAGLWEFGRRWRGRAAHAACALPADFPRLTSLHPLHMLIMPHTVS